jgi:hypothetical protein
MHNIKFRKSRVLKRRNNPSSGLCCVSRFAGFAVLQPSWNVEDSVFTRSSCYGVCSAFSMSALKRTLVAILKPWTLASIHSCGATFPISNRCPALLAITVRNSWSVLPFPSRNGWMALSSLTCSAIAIANSDGFVEDTLLSAIILAKRAFISATI